MADYYPTEEGVAVAFEVPDLKPGDYGSIVFGIQNAGNPAWVFSCIDAEDNDDNGLTGPEKRDGDNSGGTGEGDLPDNLLMLPFYDTNVGSSFFDGGEAPDSVNLDDYGDGTTTAFWDNASDTLTPQTVSGIQDTTLAQGTVNWSDGGGGVNEEEYSDTYDGCVLLNGDQENDDNTQTANPLGNGSQIQFGYDWHLPYTTDNTVQGDSLTILFGFDFQQYRHDSTPGQPNIWNPGQNTDETTQPPQ